MFSLLHRPSLPEALLFSSLHDESSFYDRFVRDLKRCQQEVIIESPFITNRRLSMLLSVLEKLKGRHVRITVNTRDPEEHDNEYARYDVQRAIACLQHLGIQVLFTVGHHRKLAIIDRKILYEGSLNILSQNDSCEVMRRIVSTELAWQMARFIRVDQFVR